MTDLAACLAAGPVMHPWIDNAAAFAVLVLPGVLFVAFLLFTILCGWTAPRALIRRIQAHRTRTVLPPAPDNQPGTDPELLADCRHLWNASFQPPRKEKP